MQIRHRKDTQQDGSANDHHDLERWKGRMTGTFGPLYLERTTFAMADQPLVARVR